MSDIKEIINNIDEDEEILQLQNKDFLAEQNQKFEELRLKLHSLKEENKRQMDMIINSLDSLMEEKCFIDKALEDLHLDDPTEPPVSVDKNFHIVDYLKQITGLDKDIEEANSVFSKKASQSAAQQNLRNGSTESSENKTAQEFNIKESVEKVMNVIEKCDTDVTINENSNVNNIKIDIDTTEKDECSENSDVRNESTVKIEASSNNESSEVSCDDSSVKKPDDSTLVNK